MILRTRTILLCYYAALSMNTLSSQQVLNIYLLCGKQDLSYLESPFTSKQTMRTQCVYCNQCNSVLAFLCCLRQQKSQKLKATVALTEMFWCQYVEVKPHRAPKSSLHVTLSCHLYAFYTQFPGPGAQASCSPTPTLSNIFQDYIFSSRCSPGIPSFQKPPVSPMGWAGVCLVHFRVACSLKMRPLSIIIQVTELLQYSQ